jgi:hypothetical protein
MGYRRDAHRVLVKRSEGKGLLERSKRTWEDNTEMEFQEVEEGGGLD